jgi:PBSX family phage terminase large subunit
VLEHTLLPKQYDFLADNDSRELLYSGAFAAGKSRALCFKLVARASVKGTREGLCRKHLVTLKATTLRTLLEPDGLVPPVLPEGSYHHNQSQKIIRIKGGGEIVYFGLDDPEKIGSYNLSGCAIDEAVEITLPDWIQLLGRIRLDVGINNQIYSACNPGSPTHFLAERFGLAGGHKPRKGCSVIQTRSSDNIFLPESYLESLEQFSGVAKARYVEGRWVGSEGTIYDHWDREVFVRSRNLKEMKKYLVGVDAGYTNPSAHLLIGEDEDGRLHVAREWYESKQLEPDVIAHALDWDGQYRPDTFVCDPSAASLIAGMRASGLHVLPADNKVFDGIQAVQARLVIAGDGRPRMTVDPTCENTIREFETYEWKSTGGEVRDVPVKSSDHAMDALRYAIVSTDGLLNQSVSLEVFDSSGRSITPYSILDDEDDWDEE